MTLVTTARKAVPELRTFARAFAIATGSTFVTRGKMGLPDLFSRDPNIIIFTLEPDGIRVRFFSEESLTADYRITEVTTLSRTGEGIKGLGTPRPGMFSSLAPIIPVSTITGEPGRADGCMIDGPQRKRFTFTMIPYGA